MVKVKDSKNAINKLAKKIKVTALQLKAMRADLKQLKDQAKATMVADSKVVASSKKTTVKKQSATKKKSTPARRVRTVTK